MRVGMCLGAALVAIGLLGLCVHAAAPQLEDGVYIYASASPLQVSADSAPCVADWNNDGRKDLIVGEYNYGNIRLYLNEGTDASPVFGQGVKLESGGQPITTSYG